jgi:hypothetical protein
MCNTYSGGGGASVKGQNPQVRRRAGCSRYNKLDDESDGPVRQGWRIESMSAYPASSSGEATVISQTGQRHRSLTCQK